MPSMIRYKYYPISKVAHITSVLIDYKMPNMNGLELYREIRKIDAKVKICFVTAFDIYPGEMKKEFHRNSNGKYQDKEEEDLVES
jgi:DNA-binding LytR/AlgR family response regulator